MHDDLPTDPTTEAPKRERKPRDPELDAMERIARALDGHDEAACRRILTWVSARYCKCCGAELKGNADGLQA